MITKQNYPKSRTKDIVVQELNGEILVYDLRDNRAMCLNETSSAVWQACDGNHSIAEIANKVGSEDLVWLALAQLREEKLLDAAPESPAFSNPSSRREALKKLALGSVLTLPMIAALAAPAAAQAVSCGLVACSGGTGSPDCASRPVGCRNCNSGPVGVGRICGP
jgi:hypothetical protein